MDGLSDRTVGGIMTSQVLSERSVMSPATPGSFGAAHSGDGLYRPLVHARPYGLVKNAQDGGG